MQSKSPVGLGYTSKKGPQGTGHAARPHQVLLSWSPPEAQIHYPSMEEEGLLPKVVPLPWPPAVSVMSRLV